MGLAGKFRSRSILAATYMRHSGDKGSGYTATKAECCMGCALGCACLGAPPICTMGMGTLSCCLAGKALLEAKNAGTPRTDLDRQIVEELWVIFCEIGEEGFLKRTM